MADLKPDNLDEWCYDIHYAPKERYTVKARDCDEARAIARQKYADKHGVYVGDVVCYLYHGDNPPPAE